MNAQLLRLLSLAALGAIASVADAGILMYGGDPLGQSYVPCGLGGRAASMVFDDFTVGGPTKITEVFGNFEIGDSMLGLRVEIRQGMSDGDPGTLLFGQNLAATKTPGNFSSGLGGSPVTLRALVSGLTLNAGDYYLGLSVITDGDDAAYARNTDGTNRIGGPLNGHAFYHSPENGVYYGALENYIGPITDLSIGVSGIAAPGPAAALPFALMALRRRKRA